MPELGDASLPDSLRVYAIGDVHGCLDQLDALYRAIQRDLESHPVDDYRIVFCGDYVDRGPHIRDVVEWLIREMAANDKIRCILGNHDEAFVGFTREPEQFAHFWLQYGGAATLQSYGVNSREFYRDLDGLRELRDTALAAVPQSHLDFIDRLPRTLRYGDFLFVHAGIRPGIPLADQDPYDLVWIRYEFLDDLRDHGFVVVHGHTPTDGRVEVRRNRINIDTGAVYGGQLTCLVIEGKDIRFLQA